MSMKLPAFVYEKAYQILCEHAGAKATEFEKQYFIQAFLDKKYPAIEYRFVGKLGHGGKFWNSGGSLHVTCYSEDRDDCIDIVNTVNILLHELLVKYLVNVPTLKEAP